MVHRFSILVFMLLWSSISGVFGQELIVDLTEIREPVADTTYVVPFYITKARAGASFTVTIEDRRGGSARVADDYQLVSTAMGLGGSSIPNLAEVGNAVSGGTFNLLIKHDAATKEGDETIELHLRAVPNAPPGATDPALLLTHKITLKNRKAPSPGGGGGIATGADTQEKIEAPAFIPDTAHAILKVFTGASFDFFDEALFKNFAGDLTLHLPDLVRLGSYGKDKTKSVRMGFNFCINNFNYYTADTSNGKVYIENITSIPADSLKLGSKYVRSTYALNSKTDIRTWSYSGQLLFSFGKPIVAQKIVRTYLTAHAETWVTNTKTTFTKENLRQDTLEYQGLPSPVTFSEYETLRPKYIAQSRVYGYFGLGPTFCVSVPKKFDFTGQAIVGKTSSRTELVTESIRTPANRLVVRQRVFYRHWPGFYLVRARVTERFTKLNGTAGVEIRGLLPQDAPFIAAYLGIQIDLANFFK